MVDEIDPGSPAGHGGGKLDDPGHGKGPKSIEIEVNTKPVSVEDREMSGAEIKAAAIDQGVDIKPTFALFIDLANGSSQPVKNDQLIRVHPHMSFSAIAPDDNS